MQPRNLAGTVTRLALVSGSIMLGACASNSGETTAPEAVRAASFGFDDPVGGLPAGFTVAATRSQAPLATWSIIADAGAPSGGHVLALTSSEHDSDGTFNLCWTSGAAFGDGTLRVAMRADRGAVDQGGGPIWRARDADNYYICRANPLERNFRVYKVEDGDRRQLATINCDVPAATWHTITVHHVGTRMTCTLNESVTLTVDDDTFPDAGGVGLWTKADAETSFDDLVVEPAE